MKIVVVATTELGACCSRGFLEEGASIDAYINLIPELRPLNAFNAEDFVSKHSIPYHTIHNINDRKSIDLIQSYNPDYLFVSWPKLLNSEVLNIPKNCVIGTHPTELPYNRGRHPLHWLIVQGYDKSFLSFFRMDEGVDSGNLLLQVPFSISVEDTINDLNSKMNEKGYEGSKLLAKKLTEDPGYKGIEQDQTKKNLWRARTPHDSIIDFRVSADFLIRTVRSFTFPYPCASLLFKNHLIKVEKAEIALTQYTTDELKRMEPGKILVCSGKAISVKAYDHVVVLTAVEPLPEVLCKAQYIHPPTKYLLEYPDIFRL